MERMQLLVSKETDDLRRRLKDALLSREEGAYIAASPGNCGPAGDLVLLDTDTSQRAREKGRAIRCDGYDVTILSTMELAGHNHAEGMLYFALIPMAYETVRQRAGQPPAAADEKESEAVKAIIEKWCLRIGVPLHIQGYQFICEAVRMVYFDPSAINSITKTLYPGIAACFATSPSKVERSIRHAVSKAWKRERNEAIDELYGFRVDMNERKPTNGEFIALLANRCRAAG